MSKKTKKDKLAMRKKILAGGLAVVLAFSTVGTFLAVLFM